MVRERGEERSKSFLNPESRCTDSYERFVTFLRTREQPSTVNELYTELRETWQRVIEKRKPQ